MDWVLEDWEHVNEEMFAIERQMQIEAEMYQWEEEQAYKRRLPAVIKIVTPITKDEAKHNTRKIPRALQTRL